MKNQFIFTAILLFFAACSNQLDTSLELEDVKTFEYLNEADQRHYVVSLVAPDAVLELKKQFTNFNTTSDEQKRASNIFLGSNKEQPVIIIRYFDNLSAATNYAFLFNEEIDMKNQFLPISQQNYRTLLRKKDYSDYKNYYESVLK